jgi:hypothetical protein
MDIYGKILKKGWLVFSEPWEKMFDMCDLASLEDCLIVEW